MSSEVSKIVGKKTVTIYWDIDGKVGLIAMVFAGYCNIKNCGRSYETRSATG